MRVAVRCSVLQRDMSHCRLQRRCNHLCIGVVKAQQRVLQGIALCCSVLQRDKTHLCMRIVGDSGNGSGTSGLCACCNGDGGSSGGSEGGLRESAVEVVLGVACVLLCLGLHVKEKVCTNLDMCVRIYVHVFTHASTQQSIFFSAKISRCNSHRLYMYI